MPQPPICSILHDIIPDSKFLLKIPKPPICSILDYNLIKIIGIGGLGVL